VRLSANLIDCRYELRGWRSSDILQAIAVVVAATIEASTEGLRRKLWSLTPIVLGVLVYVLYFFPDIGLRFIMLGARWLTLYSAAIAGSGAVIPYSRRLSSALIFLAGFDLVFTGLFFSGPAV